MRRWLFLLLAISTTLAFAQDIRDKVTAPPTRPGVGDTIDPDASIYGIAYGITEDQFISQFGNPMGYLRLSSSESGMVYGRSHCFLFTNGKLSGVRITHGIVDWKLSESLSPSTVFDQIKWRLSNGIANDMSLVQVKEILGDGLSSERYRRSFTTDKMRVELEFSQMVSEGENDSAYKLYGLLIRPK